MGKYTVDGGIIAPTSRPNILRSRLIEIVGQAIDKATVAGLDSGMDETSINTELQPEGILSTVRMTNKIDSHAWKCEGSCGCPLTAAGRVQLSHNEDGKSVDESIVLTAFYSEFDRLMGEHWREEVGSTSFIGPSAMTWTILD